ncbi:hypothetical protein BXZ70DRAFT_945473 [Cristinia sonorae]|uniref:ubiquitinyl hydrolase 1 n=1 Tax=Cristinia sonorae TaxID=1940300 RepID=A0A8K0XN51_9AGAR|nr:hypothetical protein BXZ70DRAFT_945473 [Cristinia sonorae]
MSTSEDITHLLSLLFSNYAVQQIAPLVVVVVLPLILLTAQPHIAHLIRQLYMVLESLASVLPWNWGSGSSTSGSVADRNKLKKRVVRTRAEQIVAGQDVSGSSSDVSYFEGYYPGLVNLSGSYCFMNSTLQAMASLSYLQPHIDQVFNKAESLSTIVHTPVIDELRELLADLNTPTSSQKSIRPEEIITALSRHSRGGRNPLFSSREHQDAQELFQLVSECIKREISAVDKESTRDRGLGGISAGKSSRRIGNSVFDGWTANRRSCKECGYTEAVMHFPLDNCQLALPRASAITLDMLLEDYTRLEELNDCICRRCSLKATYDRLVYEADKLTRAASVADASSSKKRRAREARSMEAKVKLALEEGRIEEEIKGLQMEKVFSRVSTKQAMIARPPAVLVLHLNRSIHYGGSDAARNNCRVSFNEYLDLTPYTTSGQLSTNPSFPISSPPRPTISQSYPRYIYRLSAVVCHYGSHYAGHYICYRRKPRPPNAGSKRWAPPRFACPFGCGCEKCQRWGPVRDEWDVRNERSSSGGWLMASDTQVQEVGLGQVLAEGAGAFMLFYERVIPYAPPSGHHRPHQGSYSKSSMRSDSASTVPTTTSTMTATATVIDVERYRQQQASGVYSSTSPKSSEETLRPGMDAHSSRSSATSATTQVNGINNNSGNQDAAPNPSGEAIELNVLVREKTSGVDGHDMGAQEDDEEGVWVRKPVPRVFLNVSTRKRARSTSVPPPPTEVPTLSAPSHPEPQIPNGNGHVVSSSHPSPPPSSQKASSPKKAKLKKQPSPLLERTTSNTSSLLSPAGDAPEPPLTPTSPASPSPLVSPSSSPRRNKGRSKGGAKQQKERERENEQVEVD